MTAEKQLETLEDLETDASIVHITTRQKVPTPIYDDLFSDLAGKHFFVPQSMLEPTYSKYHSKESWQRFSDLLEELDIKELHLVGEQAMYHLADEIKLKELEPDQIASAIEAWKQSPDRMALIDGCLAYTHQQLLKRAKNMKLKILENLIYPGKSTHASAPLHLK